MSAFNFTRDLLAALHGDRGEGLSRAVLVERVNTDPEFRSELLGRLTLEELELGERLARRCGFPVRVEIAAGAMLAKLLERAHRRQLLQLEPSDEPGARTRRSVFGPCWFGADGCRCLERALDDPRAPELGRSGVRKLARVLHGPVVRQRRSRAERRAARRVSASRRVFGPGALGTRDCRVPVLAPAPELEPAAVLLLEEEAEPGALATLGQWK